MSKHADRFTVVLDTNVLVGALTRNMLLSLAEDGLFRVRWSQTTLHQEFERTFIKLYGDGDIAARQRANIERAFPEGLVIEDPRLMASLTLPGPDDRHVLAAAIQTKAALIVTQNLKDFPPECLTPHEIEAISTDDFLADCIDLVGIEAVAAFRRMRERFHNPQIDAEALILRIEQLGLGQTATMLGEYRAVLSAPNAKRPPLFRVDSSNVDVALTCFAIVYTQAKRSTFNSLISLLYFVAGAGFEPVTFRL